MSYDLDTLEVLSGDLGFRATRPSPESIQIALCEGVTFEFHNLPEADDTVLGFSGTPWHTHGKITLMTGDATYVELDPLEILQGLKDGSVLVAEQYFDGALADRWLVHRDEKLDLLDMVLGEDLRLRRLG